MEATALRKRYRNETAADGLDLTVRLAPALDPAAVLLLRRDA